LHAREHARTLHPRMSTHADTDRQTDTLVLIARGHPRPQPRPRMLPNGRVLSVADTNAKAWIATLERTASNLLESIGGTQALTHYYGPTDGLSVRMQFRFPRESGRNGKANPREVGSPHLHTPDADNLAKLVLDCLTRRGLLAGDDSRVAHLEVTKVWDDADKVGVTVLLSKVDTQKNHAGWATKASDGSSLVATLPDWLSPF